MNQESRKLLSISYRVVLALLILNSLFLIPSIASAQLTLAPKCDPTLAPTDKAGPNGPPCNITAFIAWIHQIIRFLLVIAIPLGILFIVWGSFVIITAGGSEDKVKKGKDIILASVIGIAIALSAWLIVTTLKNVLLGGI